MHRLCGWPRMAFASCEWPDGVFLPPVIPGKKPKNPYLTNVRNTDSRFWRTHLKPTGNRCLVPVTSFAEPDNRAGDDKPSIWTWFAQDESRPLIFFAGIWREWEGDRGTKTVPDLGKHTRSEERRVGKG